MASGLFATPDQVRAAQQQNLNNSFNPDRPFDSVAQGLFGLGNAAGGSLRRFTGEDTRSNAEKDAGKITGIVKKVDFNDPNSIMGAANQLNANGFTDQAFKFLSAMPASKLPPKQIVDEVVREETVGNTTKRFIHQLDNYGFLHKVGEVSDKIDDGGAGRLFRFDQSFQSDVNFDQDSRTSFLGRLQNRPEFKSLVDDTDPEELTKFSGLIQKVANDLKDQHRDAVGQSFLGGQIGAQEANLLTARSDDFYLNEAYKRFVEGGGVEANIDRGFDIGGAGVNLSPDRDTTNPSVLLANKQRTDKKTAAIANVANRQEELVVADPKTNGFRLGKLTPQQAGSVFSRMDGKSDDQIRQELEGQGFAFDSKLFETHAQRWQIMRENPVAVSLFLTNNDNTNLREAEVTRYLDELDSNDNFQAFASATSIFKYLRRLSPPEQKQKLRGPRAR